MSKLTKYKFSDLYEMSSGISSSKQQAGHGSPFISFSTVFNNYFLPEELPDLMDTSLKEQEIFSVKKDDVFITRTSETVDALAMSCVAVKDYPKATFSGFVKRLRPKTTGIVYSKYIAFFLRSKYFRKVLDCNTIMTLRASFNEDMFSFLYLYLPDYEEQVRIGDLLYKMEMKIRTNNKINDNLADLLQTIYQGRFGNDILAVNQGVLSDICSYSTDKVAVSELNVRTYFSTENMLSGKAGSTGATSLPTTSQTTACHKGDTLISNIRPYFKKIVYCEDKCGCSTDVLCFTPSQPCYSAYLFSTLYADKFFAFMVAGSKGTKMPRGDKQQIMTYPVVLPSEEELAGFNTIASPLLEQIYSNRAENKRLSILRDTLLPKLMSGEINVSAIQL